MIRREAMLLDQAVARALECSAGTECEAAVGTLAALWEVHLDELGAILERVDITATSLAIVRDEVRMAFGETAILVSST